MEHPEIKDDDILDIIVSRAGDGLFTLRWKMSDKKEAGDALFTYISNGVKQADPRAYALMDIIIATSEGLKLEFPIVGQTVRKTTIEHIKKINDEKTDS